MSKAIRLRVLVSILCGSAAFYLWYCEPAGQGIENLIAVALLAAAACGTALSIRWVRPAAPTLAKGFAAQEARPAAGPVGSSA
jgi:hypothetical protein